MPFNVDSDWKIQLEPSTRRSLDRLAALGLDCCSSRWRETSMIRRDAAAKLQAQKHRRHNVRLF